VPTPTVGTSIGRLDYPILEAVIEEGAMPASFTVSDDARYLMGRPIGQHTAAMQREVMTELLALITTTGIRRVLIDGREQHTPLGTMEISALWEEMAPRFPRDAKFAVVVGWQFAGPPFIENVAINRGVNIRYFTEYDDAVAWLKER
jgi:hypothetical protein